ncbi:sigma factor-like helix-turn-helix DNA-binding protein [Streptomyces sp. NPDC059371]|uniref:sigma factor-like helix-turn-helix DNA-binding protein n=1 Tax=Streptomyces sp. NPDC059371 TaxID=3346812 RepID=UPI00368C3428
MVVDREAIKEAPRRLPERELTIRCMRFFKDMTQACAADRIGLSRVHVSRLITSSCAHVRDEVPGQCQCSSDSSARAALLFHASVRWPMQGRRATFEPTAPAPMT